MIKLIDTVKEVDKRLMEEKNERNSYTFSDTEHFALNLLFSIDGDKIVKKDLANRLSGEFEEILVDDEELHSRKLRQKASWLPILYYLLVSFAILGFVIYIVYFYEFTASVK